ncbi:uncharacterized protein EDB91DRAFT_1146681 [Suillus paluster]|uniref:uncharacterized protein n=1 Tax=Suillus paluster TaxID=48578 RepID=UPI001B862F0A|nr:uncharacterized protein EDB91DRAFT_1146681 [Suillus paluster]KAG1734750.1 hypothetical protein EDB91DRAFT_1146681 [Suillus paluster]
MISTALTVVSKADNVSFGLVALTVCSSTIGLVLASDAVAKEFLSNAKRRPLPKDDPADPNPPSMNDKAHPNSPSVNDSNDPIDSRSANDSAASATSIVIKPVEKYRQCPSSPSSLRVIESTETTTAPATTCHSIPCILASSNLYSKRLSIDSDTTLVPHSHNIVVPPHIYEDDRSDAHPSLRKERDPEQTATHADHLIDISIAKMAAHTLDDGPSRSSKLRPLILVANRQTTSTGPVLSLPAPAYPMDALTRSMKALSLSDNLSSARLKPLILVTRRATGQSMLLPPTTTSTALRLKPLR